MSVYKDLKERGLVDNTNSQDLETKLENDKHTFYVGFDPTADSLHVGQLLVFNVMRILQKAGHTPVAVMGGGTGFIGDPGGKSAERTLLNPETIEKNILGIRKQLEHFLDFKGKNSAFLVNNYNWLKNWSYIDFLREIGKHFSINQMITRDSVKSRIEREGSGISYTEFSYMLLQAYDFLYLAKEKNCSLQLGGSDQWGNMVSGADLCRRLLKKEVFALTHPLLTKSDGSKFGKSEQGVVWLDAKKTSAFDFYQFFIRVEDEDVIRFLKVLTQIPLERINELEKITRESPEKREAQTELADYLTALTHGTEELTKIKKATRTLYGGKITDLDDLTISKIFKDAPSYKIEKEVLTKGWKLIDALVESKSCPSKSQARKLIASGGVYVNNEQEKNVDFLLSNKNLASNSYLVLRTGKKNYRLIIIV
ncbi:MAG: tyrosine--tRNA ligase [Zetaproteobacteria bacterium]|nr:tyrosine--tRNA ligase [Pseudobdellovibrionaceae bacterium]